MNQNMFNDNQNSIQSEPPLFRWRFLILGLAIFFTIVILCGLFIYEYAIKESTTTFVVPEKTCSLLFGTTPQKFAATDGEGFNWTDDFCVSADLDKNGNLIITMTDKQLEVYRDFAEPYITNVLFDKRFRISPDYKEITIRASYDEMDDLLVSALFAGGACCVMQFTDGVPPEEIEVRHIYINSDTGEVIFDEKLSDQLGHSFEFEDGKMLLEEIE